MHIIDPMVAYILLIGFSITMIVVTTVFSRAHRWHTREGFMAAGRSVPWWLGAISICVTWIWAPALFVSCQQAYQSGLPGIFWFTFPNILSLMIVAPLAVRIRTLLPDGYSQPEWIRYRLDDRVHKLYLIVFFWYQLIAVTMQLYAGGNIFSLLTGVPLQPVMLVLAATTLAYSIISGMRASIITDILQYAIIIAGGLVVIPWTVNTAGGIGVVAGGMSGLGGYHPSLFDAQIAFNFGIVTSIGLICGSLGDQQNWQRAFTIEKKHLFRAYIVAGMLFGIVPIALSCLGFLAANPATGITLPADVDPSMIGVATVVHYLPPWAVTAYILMMLGGLCATLDSAMCATSSLFTFNCFPISEEERSVRKRESLRETLSESDQVLLEKLDKQVLYRGRLAMVGITVLGYLVSLAALWIPGFGLKYLWWILNSAGMCVVVPTVLSLYWTRLDAKGVFWGTAIGMLIGIPIFVYANTVNNTELTVAASLGILFVSAVCCLAFQRKEPFHLHTA
jgi:urea-proton symporter